MNSSFDGFKTGLDVELEMFLKYIKYKWVVSGLIKI